jgi:hypothetical protein
LSEELKRYIRSVERRFSCVREHKPATCNLQRPIGRAHVQMPADSEKEEKLRKLQTKIRLTSRGHRRKM